MVHRTKRRPEPLAESKKQKQECVFRAWQDGRWVVLRERWEAAYTMGGCTKAERPYPLPR